MSYFNENIRTESSFNEGEKRERPKNKFEVGDDIALVWEDYGISYNIDDVGKVTGRYFDEEDWEWKYSVNLKSTNITINQRPPDENGQSQGVTINQTKSNAGRIFDGVPERRLMKLK